MSLWDACHVFPRGRGPYNDSIESSFNQWLQWPKERTMGRKICYISCEGHKSSNQANMFALSIKLFHKLKHGYAYMKKNPWKPFDCKNPKESNDTKVKPLLRWYQFMSNWNLCCANPWPDLKAISIGSMFCRRAKLVNRNLEESPLLEYHFL